VNSDKVLLWLSQDGYDYHFEMDYATLGRIVEELRIIGTAECPDLHWIQAATENPPIGEYCRDHPLLIHETNEENLGVLFDVGHITR
jgi:hypothetical protein